MLYVEGDGVIRLTRGDTARFTVSIKNDLDDSEYEMKPDDVLTMTVRKKPKSNEIVFQRVSYGSPSFHIRPEDTNGNKFGEYCYDVQLKTNDDVYTIIEPTEFEILPEVTY